MLARLDKCDGIIDELRKAALITSDTEEYAEAIEKFKKEFISNIDNIISDVSKKALICALNQAVLSEEGFSQNRQLLRTELIKSDNSTVFAGLLEKAYYFGNSGEETQESVSDNAAEETVSKEDNAAPAEEDKEETVEVAELPPADKKITWQYEKKEFGAKECVADFFDKTANGYKLKRQFGMQFQLLNELIFISVLPESDVRSLIGDDGIDRLYRKGYIARLSDDRLPETVYTYTKRTQKAFLNETVKKVSYLSGIAISKSVYENEFKTYADILKRVTLSYAYITFCCIDKVAEDQMEIESFRFNRGQNYLNVEMLHRSVWYIVCLNVDMTDAEAKEIREHYTVNGNAVLRIARCNLAEGNNLSVKDDYGNGFATDPYTALFFVMEYLNKLFSVGRSPKIPQTPAAEEKSKEETKAEENIAETETVEELKVEAVPTANEEASEVSQEPASEGQTEETNEAQIPQSDVKNGEDIRSLKDMCGAIVENGLNPVDNSEEFYAVVRKLIASGRIYETIFYLGYLRYEGEGFAALYDALQYIAVMPKNKLKFSEVQSRILPEEIIGEELSGALQTAMRIIHLAFFDKDDYTIWSRDDYVKFADNNLPTALAVPSKALITELCALDVKDGGYTEEDIRYTQEKQAVTETLKKRADDLLAHPYKKKKSELLEPMLLKDENLSQGLKAVKENNEKAVEAVRSLSLRCYSKLNDNEDLVVDEDKIAAETNRVWALAREHDVDYKDQPLKGEALSDTKKYIRERAECINDWLNGLSAAVKQKYQQKDRIFSVANEMANLSKITGVDSAAAHVLEFAARRVSEFLNGDFFDVNSFAFVLGGGEILLDGDGYPEEMQEFKDKAGLEPWRSATEHFTHNARRLEQLYDDYCNSKDENLTLNNYTFRYLKEALGKEGKFHFTDENLKKIADEDKNIFRSRIEKEMFYGRVDDEEKEELFSSEALLYRYYIEERKEYGKYKKLCDRLLNSLGKLADRKIEEFESQLEKLRLEYEGVPILKNIEKAVKGRDFYLAELYISRLLSGETELSADELEEGSELGVEKFLNEYDKIYALFKDKKKLGDERIFSEFKKQFGNDRSGEVKAYFSNWDLSQKEKRAQKIRSLVSSLGFEINEINEEEDLKKVKAWRYTLTVNPESKRKTQYKIPVSKFGTDCKKITVLYLKDENEVVSAVDEVNQRGAATLVIFDGAVALSMRKQIFTSFKKGAKDNSFLFLDYVLGYYLARFRKNEVLSEFLKCTVPFTGYNFYTDDVAHLPPEMFVGREKELGIITDFSSSYQLVYGGRQLGKTALLRRAQCIVNDVAKKQYAFLITLERSDNEAAKLAEKLSRKLTEFSLIPKNEYTSCKQVLEALGAELTKAANGDVKIYLMIDESDDFFKQMSESGDDSAMSAFVELRRNRPEQFNFVFAGLHHVVRYEPFTKKNSVMGQLGATLVVTPLLPIEARRLIEIPFSFLGIKIAPEQVAHLATMAIYYPGILQTICRRIVDQIISNEKNFPPYNVDEKLLERVCSASDLNETIITKLRLTLEIDEEDNTYMPIAMLFSLYTFENAIPEGFTAEKVLEEVKMFGVKSLENLSVGQIRRLLDEMTHMNILRKIKETDSYKLRMECFAKFIARTKSDAEKYFEGDKL